MTENPCPICQRLNDANAESCWYCHAVLIPGRRAANNGGTDFLQHLRDDSEKNSQPFFDDNGTSDQNNNEEAVPEWLARIRAREQQERDTQVQDQPVAEPIPMPVEKDDLPDWLKEIKAGNSGKKITGSDQVEQKDTLPFSEVDKPESDTANSSAQNQDDAEEWLNRLAAWKPIGENKLNAGQKEENNPQSNIRLNPLTQPGEGKKEPEGLNVFEGWQRIIQEDQKKTANPVASNENPINPLAQEPIQPASDDFITDALRSESVIQPEPFVIENENTAQVKPFKESVPPEEENINRVFEADQLEENPIEEIKPFVDEIPPTSPFQKDDLPDWLATASLERKPRKVDEVISDEFSASSLDAELEKANLPAWLQAIRPLPSDSTNDAGSTSEIPVEENGLLAGIAGTLQSSQLGGDYRKPVGYGSSLKVSERQKANANLFASLVEESIDTEDVEETKNDRFKRIAWRLVVAVSMICIILFADRFLAASTIQPALFPPEVVSFYDQVNLLSPEKPVLITGDFEPAASGELSMSSKTMLEHLMRRGINFAVLSNNPAGASILMKQLEEAGKLIPGYDVSSHVINLGYLPGGSTGLQLMTENLRAAVPHTYDTYDIPAAWNSSILYSVNSLNDFGTVIVLSDKAESARVWVEQLQPALNSTPLLFVISAQAAPLIEPYYQSGQISGYIAGYSGEIAYEKIFPQTDNSNDQMSAFQSTILFVAILLLVGGLVNLVRPVSSEPKK